MEGLICLGIALVPIIVITFIFVSRSNTKEAWRQARQVYLDALEMLKRDPQNPDLREQVLALGRHCTQKTNECLQTNIGGVTSFDEVALMNDINAACAYAGGAATSREEKANPSVEERLVKLDELRAKQLITD